MVSLSSQCQSVTEKKERSLFLEEQRKKDEKRILKERASAQLAQEGKLWVCDTKAGIREQDRRIRERVKRMRAQALLSEFKEEWE